MAANEKGRSCTSSECITVCATSATTPSSTDHDCSIKSSSQCTSVNLCFADSPAPIPQDSPPLKRGIYKLRRCMAEFCGTGLLLLIVVGSGIMAEDLTSDVGLQLLINSFATGCGLYGLITMFGPISGAHLNPIVSFVDTLYGDMKIQNLVTYILAQVSGAIVGTILANVQFKEPTAISDTERFGYNLWISEVIATCTLILVIHGCIRTGQKQSVPTAVSAWVAGGYFFTSSSIFANPAVTIGRIFTRTFAGIEPRSMGAYVGFQILGGLLGFALCKFFYPRHLQPLTTDDNLYRRVCLLDMQDFVNKASY